MIRRIVLLNLILLSISCGKDVVIVEEPTPPTEQDETYEVNLIGFTTDEDRVYIPNTEITVDEVSMNSDESAFFYTGFILLNNSGKVFQTQHDNYIPGIHRVSHHRSLEDVIFNLKMIELPTEVNISVAGGSIKSDESELFIESNVLLNSTSFIFQSFVGKRSNIGNSDQLYFGDETEFLFKEASFYFSGSSTWESGSKADVRIDIDALSSTEIDRLSVYKYDLSLLKWELTDIPLSNSGSEVSFSIDSYGWWTVAESIPAQYGTLNLSEIDDDISTAEVEFSFDNNAYTGQTSYSSTMGSISMYFPVEKSITAFLNEGQFQSEAIEGFKAGENTRTINFEENLQSQFEGKVYNCEFDLSSGFVAIISEGQHKIRKIENGVFGGEAFVGSEDVILLFYDNDYNLLSTKSSNIESLKSETNSFLSCDDLNDKLMVTSTTSVLQDYNMCTVKVRPNETVVIGEKDNGDVFLVSFVGSKEGIYEGLFYDFPEIIEDVKSEVTVNIILFDELENKVGGFVKTEYISTGEELIISFIGNIE